jgi:hypothetical protein
VVLHLENKSWTYWAKGEASVLFASASTPDQATLTVELNGEEVECVHLAVPHSWWPNAGQQFCPPLHKGDRLKISADGTVALRLDLNEAAQ